MSKKIQQQLLSVSRGRFSNLFSAESCLRPIYDQAVLENSEWVVVPTLGSIVPKWLLVVPRKHFINFSAGYRQTSCDPHEIIDLLADRWNVHVDRMTWFEHGAAASGSPVGCGVEHAHIHVLVDPPFSYDALVNRVRELADLNWHEGSARTVYSHLNPKQSYLVVANGDRAIMSTDVESAGSQFFRRAIAHLVGRPDEWNYRQHFHLENIRQTLDMFGKQPA